MKDFVKYHQVSARKMVLEAKKKGCTSTLQNASFDWCSKLVINSSDSCQPQKSLPTLEGTHICSRSTDRQMPHPNSNKIKKKNCSFFIACKHVVSIKVKFWPFWSKWRNSVCFCRHRTVQNAISEGTGRAHEWFNTGFCKMGKPSYKWDAAPNISEVCHFYKSNDSNPIIHTQEWVYFFISKRNWYVLCQ